MTIKDVIYRDFDKSSHLLYISKPYDKTDVEGFQSYFNIIDTKKHKIIGTISSDIYSFISFEYCNNKKIIIRDNFHNDNYYYIFDIDFKKNNNQIKYKILFFNDKRYDNNKFIYINNELIIISPDTDLCQDLNE